MQIQWEQLAVMDFLGGLGKKFDSVRSQILGGGKVATLSETFSRVLRVSHEGSSDVASADSSTLASFTQIVVPLVTVVKVVVVLVLVKPLLQIHQGLSRPITIVVVRDISNAFVGNFMANYLPSLLLLLILLLCFAPTQSEGKPVKMSDEDYTRFTEFLLSQSS